MVTIGYRRIIYVLLLVDLPLRGLIKFGQCNINLDSSYVKTFF